MQCLAVGMCGYVRVTAPAVKCVGTAVMSCDEVTRCWRNRAPIAGKAAAVDTMAHQLMSSCTLRSPSYSSLRLRLHEATQPTVFVNNLYVCIIAYLCPQGLCSQRHVLVQAAVTTQLCYHLPRTDVQPAMGCT